MQTPINTDRLAELMGKKHDIMSQLHELVRQQVDHIREGDMSRLMTIFAAKQKLITQVQYVERQLDPFRDQDPERREWRESKDRQHVAKMAERCQVMLAEIKMIEKQGETELVRRRDEVDQRLRHATNASEARHAYIQSTGPRPTGLDLTSE